MQRGSYQGMPSGVVPDPFRLTWQIERLPRPCPCVLCRDRARKLTWLHPHLMEIKIPALSQKTRQERGTLEGKAGPAPKSQPIIIIARLLSSEPWSLERFQVYSPEGSRHGYLISQKKNGHPQCGGQSGKDKVWLDEWRKNNG